MDFIGFQVGSRRYESNTPEVLAKSLGKLLSEPDELDRLSRNGKEGVEKHFHIDIQAQRMVQVYEEAIGSVVPVQAE